MRRNKYTLILLLVTLISSCTESPLHKLNVIYIKQKDTNKADKLINVFKELSKPNNTNGFGFSCNPICMMAITDLMEQTQDNECDYELNYILNKNGDTTQINFLTNQHHNCFNKNNIKIDIGEKYYSKDILLDSFFLKDTIPVLIIGNINPKHYNYIAQNKTLVFKNTSGLLKHLTNKYNSKLISKEITICIIDIEVILNSSKFNTCQDGVKNEDEENIDCIIHAN